MTELQKLSIEVEALSSGTGRRYPADLRIRLVAAAHRCAAAGETWTEICDTLDVPLGTLRTWDNNMTSLSSRRTVPVMKPVIVVPEEPVSEARADRAPRTADALTIVTPAGFRVEGLDASTALALLRELQ